MQRELSVERLEAIAVKALNEGYGRMETWAEDDDPRLAGRIRRRCHLLVSMDCEDPYEAVLFARDSAWYNRRKKPMTVIVHSRCRKCKPCLERRAVFWQARATWEYTMAPATYFGTLTTDPRIDAEADARAQRDLWARGVDFGTLTEQERFRIRVKYVGKNVTDYLKRVREGRTSFRYLCVAEMHNSQATQSVKRYRPHWHILLHDKIGCSPLVIPDEWETDALGNVATDRYGNPYLKNTAYLKEQWADVGFSTFALCRSPQAAAYMCKYLTKAESMVRIRNSFRYGGDGEAEPIPGAVAPAVRNVGEATGRSVGVA